MKQRYFTLVKIVEWLGFVVFPIILAVYILVKHG